MKNRINEILDNPKIAKYEILNQYVIYKTLIKLYNYKVVLYGGGSNIIQIIKWLKSENIFPQYIIDIDDKKSGEFIEGAEIINPLQIKNKIKNPEIYFTFITTTYYLIEIEKMKITKMLFDNGLDKQYYLLENNILARFSYREIPSSKFYYNREKLLWALDVMADDESKEILIEYIRIFLENDSYRLGQLATEDKYWGTIDNKNSIYEHFEDEILVNCGSFIGDTIYSYIDNGYSFSKIYAFECDNMRIAALKSNIDLLPKDMKDKIEIICELLGDEKAETNFDNLFRQKKVTLINMDIEGAELEVLKGAKNIIKTQEPVLAISAYHKAEDIWTIPEYIKSCSNNYSFYLRKYVSSASDALKCAELILYAIPKSRLEK